MKFREIKGFMVGAFVVASSLSVLAVVQIPNVFKSGDLITADGMNQNFSSLKAGIDALEASVTTKQNRVSGSCAVGSSIRVVNADGTVECQLDNGGSGGSSYTAGTGLKLTGSQFSVDGVVVQTRVAGACTAGSAMREVLANGQVVCETFPASGGTVQTDATLVGDGSNAAKLGVKLPLALIGSSTGADTLLRVENSGSGSGLVAQTQAGDALSGVSLTSGTGVSAASLDGTALKAWSVNGFAIEARGNLKQNRDSFGLPKAMVSVRINPSSGFYEIMGCFNSQQNGVLVYSNGCGIALTPHASEVDVNFGFYVGDRFVNITSTNPLTLYAKIGDTNTTSTIITAVSTATIAGGGNSKLSFQMIVY